MGVEGVLEKGFVTTTADKLCREYATTDVNLQAAPWGTSATSQLFRGPLACCGGGTLRCSGDRPPRLF